MLKRLCQHHPCKWDQFLPALLFTYCEVPQQSLGFSPFELLFGQQVRGPLVVIYQVWTDEEAQQEVKTMAEYITDLRNKLEEMKSVANENLSKSASCYSEVFDKKAVEICSFKQRSKVLLLPSQKHKLEIGGRVLSWCQ